MRPIPVLGRLWLPVPCGPPPGRLWCHVYTLQLTEHTSSVNSALRTSFTNTYNSWLMKQEIKSHQD